MTSVSPVPKATLDLLGRKATSVSQVAKGSPVQKVTSDLLEAKVLQVRKVKLDLLDRKA